MRIHVRRDEILEIYRALYYWTRHDRNITEFADPERKEFVKNLEERFKLLLEEKQPSQYKRRRTGGT
jgi:hypothetical protein